MPKLTRDEEGLALSLSGSSNFTDALARVKIIPGRRFDGENKLWRFPDDPKIAERILLTIQPSADAALLGWVRSSRSESDAELSTKLSDDADLRIPWADKLYDYQRAAVDFMADHPRILLADDMGLGKTLQALSAQAEFLIRNEINPGQPKLVICPSSAKGVWAREIRKWLGDDEPYVIVQGTAKQREKLLQEGIKKNAWVIVNWEQVRAVKRQEDREVHHRDGSVSMKTETWYEMKEPLFEQTEWLTVIADEAHRAKNRKAAQTQGLWRIDAPLKLALTGTPLMNSPDELWSILKWLYPEQYGKSSKGHPRTAFWAFHDQYTESYEGYGGSKIVVGVKNPDALRFELQNRLIRRTKGEKLNLPPKVRQTIPVTLNPKQRKLYEKAEKEFWLAIEQAVKEGDKDATKFAEGIAAGKKVYEISNGAARTVRLRQVASSPALLGAEDDSAKLDAAVEIITDNQPKQFVVFCEFVETVHLLVERLRKPRPHGPGLRAEAFTGEVDSALRTVYEDRFQNGEIDVLVGTIGAMRESITLTAADTVIFTERAWVPGWNEQAEDRLWRNGQENAVTVIILEAEDTVDVDKIKPTNEIKQMIVKSVLKQDEIKEVAA